MSVTATIRPRQAETTRIVSLRLVFAATLAIAFFVAGHDLWYSTEPYETVPADSFAAATASGSGLRQLSFAAVAVVSLLVLLTDRGPRRLPRGVLGGAVVGLLICSALSVLWADAPGLAIRRLGVLGVYCLAALAAARQFSAKDTLSFAAITSAAYIFIGLIAEASLGTFHPFQEGYRFAGTLHPNGQGTTCAVLCLSSLALMRGSARLRVLRCLGAAAGAVFLLWTGSRTAFASALLIASVYALATQRNRVLAGFTLWAAISVAVFVALVGGGSMVSDVGDSVLLGRQEGTTTLTWRVELWKDLLYYVRQQPSLGFGYGAFWTPARIMEVSEQQWSVSSAHSDYLEIALALGGSGLAMYLLTIVAALHRAARVALSATDPYACSYFGLLLFYCLSSLLESHLFNPGLLTFLALLAIANLGFRESERHADRVAVYTR